MGTDYSPVADTNNEAPLAVKLEHESVEFYLLEQEVRLYKSLAGGQGIPAVYWFGREGDYSAMVFELLGPSLEDLFNYCNRQFSLKTVLMIADQLLCRLRYVHSKKVIHQDIKPDNFLMGRGKSGNCIYVTDLGVAAECRPRRAWIDVRPTDPDLLDTARFASVRGHLGIGMLT
jgi:casein kinase I homolog HRR25